MSPSTATAKPQLVIGARRRSRSARRFARSLGAHPAAGITNTYTAPCSMLVPMVRLGAPATIVLPEIATEPPRWSFEAPSRAVSSVVWLPPRSATRRPASPIRTPPPGPCRFRRCVGCAADDRVPRDRHRGAEMIVRSAVVHRQLGGLVAAAHPSAGRHHEHVHRALMRARGPRVVGRAGDDRVPRDRDRGAELSFATPSFIVTRRSGCPRRSATRRPGITNTYAAP